MPVTRSSSKNSRREDLQIVPVPKKQRLPVSRQQSKVTQPPPEVSLTPALAFAPQAAASKPVTAVLSFSFEDAKRHLIDVDRRFQDIFNKMKCKPYQNLEEVQPFRELTTSILGQQISFLAARSITHRFIRLYDPNIPENVKDYEPVPGVPVSFPTPAQVANTDIATLRTAGLSVRKAEYVKDLATRFADGRLSTEKLQAANDEDLAKMLTEVRGIGKWTGMRSYINSFLNDVILIMDYLVDMFAMFSLRRPDILPVGDLGVQRGLVRWFLALHSSAYPFGFSPEKLPGSKIQNFNTGVNVAATQDEDALPIFGETLPSENDDDGQEDTSGGELAEARSTDTSMALIPPTFTPSIQKTLTMAVPDAVPLPAGLSVGVLKSRLDGKKIKGAFLTPSEMEALTESWKPYRSIGVYYMWSLAEAGK